MSTDPRHRLGRLGEAIAVGHLHRLGHTIVARNHRTRFGELDVISLAGDTLVFCEVKTRRGEGDLWNSLHERKRTQVRRMAAAYLAEVGDRPRANNMRFDAIAVVIDVNDRLSRLEHLEAAF